jgi:tRNA U34 5-methylaminomethyl-2-thiouridine-forming methyltransferase MnmC
VQDQTAHIAWRDGELPVSTRFDDPYFSLQGGLAETSHVFLAGNDLPARFRDGFPHRRTWLWHRIEPFIHAAPVARAPASPARLHFTTFEAFPHEPPPTCCARNRPFRSWIPSAGQSWPRSGLTRPHRLHLEAICEFTMIVGDARETLSHWWHGRCRCLVSGWLLPR